MMIQMPLAPAEGYRSASQQTRRITEAWLGEQGYCVACGATLLPHANNHPVGDFYCDACKAQYELKSKRQLRCATPTKIVDGAYQSMILKIEAQQQPHFFFLSYTPTWQVQQIFVVPQHYITKEVIEQRPPLKETARRAGWVGCNIDLRHLPQSGKIALISQHRWQAKADVLHAFQKTQFLREETNNEARGWLVDILFCIEQLGKPSFTLPELYGFQDWLQQRHSNNHHIEAKIRQQLQVLRDKQFLSFEKRGHYQLR